MAHRHEDLLRRAYAAFARGDLAEYLSVCTDSISFRVPGRSAVAGTYSREQFASGLIAKVMEASGGTFRETVVDVIANDTRGSCSGAPRVRAAWPRAQLQYGSSLSYRRWSAGLV